MSQVYTWPSQSISASNPSIGVNGIAAPAQSTQVAGQDAGGDLRPLLVDSDGKLQVEVTDSVLPSGAATEATLLDVETNTQTSADVLTARLSGSLVPAAYDEVLLTYVAPGNDGEGQVETATYRLATVVVKTLTLSYDTDDRLSGVVAS